MTVRFKPTLAPHPTGYSFLCCTQHNEVRISLSVFFCRFADGKGEDDPAVAYRELLVLDVVQDFVVHRPYETCAASRVGLDQIQERFRAVAALTNDDSPNDGTRVAMLAFAA